MKTSLNLFGPYLKIERSEQHIIKLEQIFRYHISSSKKSIVPSKNPKNQKLYVAPLLPKHTSTILGDAIHNLRASLDHAYCVLVQANKGTINRQMFPFTKGSRKEFEDLINRQAKKGCMPSNAAVAHIFDVIQPYAEGNGADLLAVHLLDIADKHMVLLPTDQITLLHRAEFKNEVGRSAATFKDIKFVVPGAESAVEMNGKFKGSSQNTMTVEICFGRGQPLEGEPIIPTLNLLLERVFETIKSLEPFIARRD